MPKPLFSIPPWPFPLRKVAGRCRGRLFVVEIQFSPCTGGKADGSGCCRKQKAPCPTTS